MRMEAAIFDLDGTLLDSTGLWDTIDADFLAARGLAVPPDYADAVSALSFPEAAEYTVRRFGLSDTPESLLAEWRGMAADAYAHTLNLKPHAAAYVAALKARGIKLAIATSQLAPLCALALARHGLAEAFDVVCTTDQVARGKQFPDIYLEAAQRLGVPPACCWVFEDLPEAVQSAKQAGMTVYAVYDHASRAQWEQTRRAADGFLYDFKDAPLPE